MRARSKINIRDIAGRAGVSTAAVSAVLNNKTGGSIRVGGATREKILAAVRELDYVPDLAARRLVSGRSHIVSVFTFESVFPFSAQNEFHDFLVGIEEQAENLGYDILMITNRALRDRQVPGWESEISRLRMADGGILIGIKRDQDLVARLIDDGFPLVLVGRRDIHGRPVNYISYDYKTIVSRLFDLAEAAGADSLVYARLADLTEPYADRLAAVKAAGRRHASMKTTTVELSAASELPALLAERGRSPKKRVFVLERRELAVEFESHCAKTGLRPGLDVSAMLLEDQWFSSRLRWTCWSNIRARLGARAFILLDRLVGASGAGEKPAVELLLPEVVAGETLTARRGR